MYIKKKYRRLLQLTDERFIIPTVFKKFNINTLYKEDGFFTIPIEHVVSILTGKSDLSNIDELKITLETITNKVADFFNISSVIEESKTYIINRQPSLERLIQYKYSKDTNENIMRSIRQQFGKEVKLSIDINKR